MVPALVTDAHSRAAVAGLRALGAAGVPALALAACRRAPGHWSRHAAGRLLGPPPEPDARAFVARIGALAREHGSLVVMPGQEQAVGALVRAADELPAEAILPYGDMAGVQAVRDKGRLAELGADAGLRSPAILAEGTAAEVAAARPGAPSLLKARDLSDALPATLLCDTEDELQAALAALPADEPVVVQERAAGTLIAVSLVLDPTGRVAARFQQAARRLWPTRAGASSVAVSVAPDERLVERAAALLRAAGFWGLAQVQLVDTARGPAVIDVNPRFYGSLPLAVAAGVNLPATWHAVATGSEPPPVGPYAVGVTYRWLEAELTAVYNGEFSRLRHRAARPRVGAMWAGDDPLPGVLLAAEAAAARVRRRVGRA